MSTDLNTFRQTSTDYLKRFGQASTEYLKRFGEDLLAALLYPFQSILRAILALILAGFTFVVLILAAQSMGVLNEIIGEPALIFDFEYIKTMFLINFNGTVRFDGWTPIGMNVVYGLLTGVALTNMVAQLRMMRMGSLSNIGGIIPGLFAAGCASCGPGLFALVGLTGAVGAIPFQGTVLRLAGIGMFLFFLGLSGDPRECRID